MANMVLQTPADVPATSSVLRFSPKYWEVNGDYLTALSVVTTGEDSAVATFVLRSNTSLPGLYFWVSEGNVRDHARESYDTVFDWRGTTLEFRIVSDGVRSVAGVLGAPGLTINHTNDTQSIIDLGNYVVSGSGTDVTIRLVFSDTDPGRVKRTNELGELVDFDRSNIASMFFNVAIDEYQYGQCSTAAAYSNSGDEPQLELDVTSGNGLPFMAGDTLYLGNDVREIEGVEHISGDDYRLTLDDELSFNYPTPGIPCYVIADSANYQAFENEITASLTFSDITITGSNAAIPLRHQEMPAMGLSQTDDYSFAKLVTPERIASENWALGYRGLLNLYWSSTGFERLKWKTTDPLPSTYGYERGGRWEVDETDPRFNDAFRVWALDLLSRTDVILSQSMEILMHFMPEGWAQLDADGNRAASGYGNASTPLLTPWTNFIDPASEDAKAWVLGMAEDFKSLCNTAGREFHPQLGEPNHWNGYDNAAKYGTWPKPCIYGSASIDRFALEQGFSLAGTIYSVTGASRTISRSSGTFANVKPGMWVRTAGFSEDENNGWWRVASSTPTTLAFADLARKDETATAVLDRGPGWTTGRTTSASFAVDSSANEITGPSFVWAFLEVGDEVQFSGFANEGNNGSWVVVSISETVAAFQPASIGQTMVDEAAGAAVTLKRTPQRYISNSPTLDFSEGSLDEVTLSSRQELLSSFLIDVAEGYSSAGAIDTRVLILPSNFLSDLGGMYNVMNRAVAGLSPSVWSIAQWEPYDAEQTGNVLLER